MSIESMKLEYEESSGNVFEDLGLPDSDELLRKAALVDSIRKGIRERGWTQQKAADVLGISQPKLSLMLRGRFNGISETKIMDCVAKMGNDVRIVVTPCRNSGADTGRIQVVYA